MSRARDDDELLCAEVEIKYLSAISPSTIGRQLEESIIIVLFDSKSKTESDYQVKFSSAWSDITVVSFQTLLLSLGLNTTYCLLVNYLTFP